MHDIDRLVAGIAPDPGPPGLTPLARQLMEEITARPVRRRFLTAARLRRWAAVPVVATLAALLSVGVAQAPASAALDIELVDDHYVITVKDLMADPQVYERELRARGIDITLTLVPTSASLAGQMVVLNEVDLLRTGRTVSGEGPITTIDAAGPCERFAGCPVGLRVPVGYAERAEIVLARRALPGETYRMPPGIAMPGEPLHCVDYVNQSVTEVTALLRERGVTPVFVSSQWHSRPSAPGDWYVHDGVMRAAGQANLLVGPEPREGYEPPAFSC